MGIDAAIYISVADEYGQELDDLADGVFTRRVTDPDDAADAPRGATHEVIVPWRYYDDGYERGPWPLLAGVLMALLANPHIHAVWYGGDHVTPGRFSRDRLVELTDHYLRY